MSRIVYQNGPLCVVEVYFKSLDRHKYMIAAASHRDSRGFEALGVGNVLCNSRSDAERRCNRVVRTFEEFFQKRVGDQPCFQPLMDKISPADAMIDWAMGKGSKIMWDSAQNLGFAPLPVKPNWHAMVRTCTFYRVKS
jgi:hypothetical protein